MKKRIGTLCLMIMTIGSASPALGERFEWDNGGSDTDWRTEGNWDKAGYPDDGDEAVFVSGPTDWPTFTNNEAVDSLTIGANAELTVSGATLTIDEPNGLTVAEDGELKIGAGTLKLSGGGIIDLDGQITLQGPSGTLSLSETTGEVYVIPTTGVLGAGIVGLISSSPSSISGVGDAVLVIEDGVAILGVLNIEVALVNNGEVHADRLGDLTLACNEKSGEGLWKVSDTNARLVSNVPVAGGPCSVVEISDGILDVNANWVSCGSLWMTEAAGKIEVAAEKRFRAGGKCGTECVCAKE